MLNFRRFGFAMTLWVSLLIVMSISLVVIGVAPIARCPKCDGCGWQDVEPPVGVSAIEPCTRCGNTGKVPPIRRWTFSGLAPAWEGRPEIRPQQWPRS